MIENLRDLPITEKLQLVEDLWDSIADDRQALPLSVEQRMELDRRLDEYEVDGIKGRRAADVIAGIRKRM
jgi:putative addiction module component (TIGR02574 family)